MALGIEHVRIAPGITASTPLEFISYPYSHSLLTLALLVLKYQNQRPALLAIEEPERGLHPYLLEKVVATLRSLSVDADRPMQIVLATHSAELLEYCSAHEVRFLRRSREDGNVVVHQVDTTADGWARAYREYDESLGDLWLSGNLGGIPGT